MSRQWRNLVPILAMLACRAEGDRAVTPVSERDSSGVRIAEYETPAPVLSMTLSDQPAFQHGGRPDDYPFQSVWDAALQPDGGAVVVDRGAQQVVLLGPDGSFRSVLAKTGPGPAEVRDVMSVTVLGQDTILVEDDGNGRLVTFQHGEVARSLSTAADFSLNIGLRVLAVDDARRALTGSAAFRPNADEPWITGHMVRIDLQTGSADTVATYDMAQAVDPREPMNPFLPSGYVAAWSGGFVYGRSDRPELIWRDPSGAVRRIVRWSAARTYPTDDDWDEWTAGLRADLRRVNPGRSGQALDDLVSSRIARYEIVPTEPLPLWSELTADREGRIWIAQYAPGGANADVERYTVIGPNAEWLGAVEMPPRFRLLDAGNGLVLGVLKDAMDVEYVTAYRLRVSDEGR